MKTFRSLLSLLLATSTCEGELITAKSFGGPFTTLDHTGARTLTNYEVAGHAKVHNSFVRLTPDRQSKRGFVWGEAPLGTCYPSAAPARVLKSHHWSRHRCRARLPRS